MKIKNVIKSISKLLLVEAALLVLPIIVGLIYGEPKEYIMAYVYTIAIIVVISLPGILMNSDTKGVFSSEGFVIVTLAWILLSFFGGLPLYFSYQYQSLVDTFFEVSSGFTTTGASVLADVSNLSNSIKFWKAFIQAIGGMGFLVFALAIIPNMGKESIHLMKAEVPGPVFGKVVSKLGDTARTLYKIYFVMIVGLTVVLMFAGMSFFDAILHSLETAGTGGFSIYNGSLGYYDSPAIDIIISIGMLLFSINFALYHLILINKAKNFFKSEELKWFIIIVIGSITLITIDITKIYGFWNALRYSLFTVSSTISTTGFSNVDFGTWPLFSQIIILLTMIIGGMSGSTAGGIKVSRIGAALKSSFAQMKKSRNPKRVLMIKFDGKLLDGSYLRSLSNYLALYTLVFILLLISVSLDLNDFMSAFSAVAATFNNIGPGLGQVGPSESFGMLSDFNKILLSFGMIAGRLEIIPMIVLFSPETWRKI